MSFERPKPSEQRDTRELVLQRGIDAIRAYGRGATGADRGQALRAEMFLKSVTRDHARSMQDVAEKLREIAQSSGVTDALKTLLEDHSRACERDGSHETGFIVLPALSAVLPKPLVSGKMRESGQPEVRSASIGIPGTVGDLASRPQFGSVAGDTLSLGSLGRRFESQEVIRQAHRQAEEEHRLRVRESRRAFYAQYFRDVRVIAERFVERILPKDATSEDISIRMNEVLVTMVHEGECLREHFSFDPAVIRHQPDEEFFASYFDSLDRAGEEAHELNDKIREYLGLRARLAVFLRREVELSSRSHAVSPLKSSELLGISETSSRDDIEVAYVSRLAALDPDRPDDAEAIAALHVARETMLQDEERREAKGAHQSQTWDPDSVTVTDRLNPLHGLSEKRPQSEARPAWGTEDPIPDLRVEDGAMSRRGYLDGSAQGRESGSDVPSEWARPRSISVHDLQDRVDGGHPDDWETRSWTPKASPPPGTEAPKSRFRRMMDAPLTMLGAPGRALRMLFGVAALGGAGLAVHEFAQNDSEEPVVDMTPRNAVDGGLSESEPSLAAAPDQDIVKKEQTQNEASRAREVTLGRGDSVWKIVIGMLRDRGLSTSNAQVQYFTHQALVDNGWTALSALEKKPGETLDVTHIAQMMDAVAGGGDVATVTEPVKPERAVDANHAIASMRSSAEVHDDVVVRGSGSGDSVDWERGLVDGAQRVEAAPGVAKPYSELPTADHAEHVMAKGESIYKMVHTMLRSRGLNWTTERINFLTQLVVNKNADRFREMVADGRMRKMDDVWIPAGAMLDFSDAVAVVDDMERAKKAGKKAKTVKELAKERGYAYPVMMKFPRE